MKSHLIEIGLRKEQLFSIKKIDQHHFEGPFHFHDLFEMNYVVESFGQSIVGSNVSNFSSGDLVLMGPNLPHIWYNDPSYFKDNSFASAKAIVTYFSPTFLIGLTNDLHCDSQIRNLLERAKRGLRFFGDTQQHIISKLDNIINTEGLEKVVIFFEIINILLKSKEYEMLAPLNYHHSFNEKDTQRMNNVYQYIFQNFTEVITLDQIASVANLTPPAFCSFFKKRTQKSFSTFLNELRIGHSCHLLQKMELTIADVCFQSGYQNMTNFNHFFKKIMKKNPSQYRKEYNALVSQVTL